jgi:predicted DNA-binding transcriptional regulator AlpA
VTVTASPPEPGHSGILATYTVAELAGLLRVSERHAWRLVGRDAVPGLIRLGRVTRLARAVVDAWIASGCPARGTEGNPHA